MSDVDALRYRLAAPADAPAIAALHAESWRSAYRGMLPDDFLDNDVFADRMSLWQQRFYEPVEGIVTVTVLAEAGEELVGFAHSIVDDDAEWGTLLDNLHARPDRKRRGIGKRLMAETAAWLRACDRATLYLWVLEENHAARRFYEALGGRVVGSGVSPEGGGSAPSLRISWPDVEVLCRELGARHVPLE